MTARDSSFSNVVMCGPTMGSPDEIKQINAFQYLKEPNRVSWIRPAQPEGLASNVKK